MTRLVVIGWGAWMVCSRLRVARPAAGAAVAVVAAAAPLGGAALGSVLIAGRRWRTAAARTAERRQDVRWVTAFADLAALGLTAGLSLRAAFAEARAHVEGRVAREIDVLLGEMDRVGAAQALAAADGLLADLGRVAAGAAASGAPVAAAISAHATTRREVEHAARVAAARRLPVRLLLPLALLILPGFVVLAVGPALLQALARLGPAP